MWADPRLRSRWLVLNNVVLDLAARNGTEPLPRDGWGLSPVERHDALTEDDFDAPAEDDLTLVDAAAAAAADTDEEVRRLCADPRLAVSP